MAAGSVTPVTCTAMSSLEEGRILWSQEATSLLIQLYKKHPVLYASANSDYKNKGKRLDALKAIRLEMLRRGRKISVEEIKKKIHGLRTQYTHQLSKMKKSEETKPTLWCFNQLDFIGNSSEGQPAADDENTNESRDMGQFNAYEQNEDSQEVGSFYDYSIVKQEDTHSNSVSEAHVFTPASDIAKNERNEDCVTTFAKLVELELRKVTNPQALRKAKREIINVLMDAQEACDN